MTVATLPPATKLSLVDRKDVRDNWEGKKAEVETALTKVLGVPWTVDVDPLTIAPYTTTDRPGRLGDIIMGYMESVEPQLANIFKYQGDIVKDALNAAASKHVLSLGVDEEGKFSYCGPIIKDGQLVIVFKPGSVWTNVGSSLDGDRLLKAIDAAEAASGAAGALSTTAKTGIAKNFTPKIGAIEKEIRTILKNDAIKLNPNFEAVAAALGKSDKAEKDWESRLGGLAIAYYEGVSSRLKQYKFDTDDMLQEAFQEAVPKNEIALRVVDKLHRGRSSYTEASVEDGVLYINFPADRFGTNCGDGAADLVEILDEAI